MLKRHGTRIEVGDSSDARELEEAMIIRGGRDSSSTFGTYVYVVLVFCFCVETYFNKYSQNSSSPSPIPASTARVVEQEE